jgi:hypothetical protein
MLKLPELKMLAEPFLLPLSLPILTSKCRLKLEPKTEDKIKSLLYLMMDNSSLRHQKYNQIHNAIAYLSSRKVSPL